MRTGSPRERERTVVNRGPIRRLNLLSGVPPLVLVAAVSVFVDADTLVQAAVMLVGASVGVVGYLLWTSGDLHRFLLPLLAAGAAVWVLAALVTGGATGYLGLAVVGTFAIPTLPRHRYPAIVGLIAFTAAVGGVKVLLDGPDVLHEYVTLPAAVTALMAAAMFPSQRFYDIVNELDEAREREAELAVVRERVRFASDLHDIQGHTLHVVKLKVALAQKLLRVDVDRAEEELREVHALVADTIAQTKDLVYAQRRLNLSAELENAKNLFEAAGIRVRLRRESDVDEGASELLGQVLRETTTNILRHAQATRVAITLSASTIAIVNDGAQDAPPVLRGLATLAERLAGRGGTLTAEQRHGSFTTAAELPATGQEGER